jgi:hypothetical protein
MSLKQTTNCLGYQQITNHADAVGLSVHANATYALIRAVTQSVRWRDDGTNPTGTVGMILTVAPDELRYDGDLKAIKFIETAASAQLNISYYA